MPTILARDCHKPGVGWISIFGLIKTVLGLGSSRSGECEMEHCSSQPANKPQLRVTGRAPLGPFSCPDLDWDILRDLFISLHIQVRPQQPTLKGVSRRYTHQLLSLAFYFSQRDRGAGWPPISANLAIRTKDDLDRVGDWVSYLLYCHYSIFYSYLENVTNGVHDPSPANGNTETAPRSGATETEREMILNFSYLILSGDTIFSDWQKY